MKQLATTAFSIGLAFAALVSCAPENDEGVQLLGATFRGETTTQYDNYRYYGCFHFVSSTDVEEWVEIDMEDSTLKGDLVKAKYELNYPTLTIYSRNIWKTYTFTDFNTFCASKTKQVFTRQ